MGWSLKRRKAQDWWGGISCGGKLRIGGVESEAAESSGLAGWNLKRRKTQDWRGGISSEKLRIGGVESQAAESSGLAGWNLNQHSC